MEKPPDFHRLKWWSLLLCLPLAAGALHLHLPSFWGGFIGDSAVYYAMADSLAHDGDLLYTRNDLLRITAEWPGGPQGILLVADPENPSVIHYAKPFLYSLAAAPLTRLFRANGPLLLNALCFSLLVFLGFLAFPDRETRQPIEPIVWSFVFWGISAVPAYVFNIAPDLFNGTLLMAGLIPWVRCSKSPNPLRRLSLSAFLLTIAATSRPPNALFLLLPFWSVLFGPLMHSIPEDITPAKPLVIRLKGLLSLAAAVFTGAGASYLLALLMTGQGFAYSGFRKRIVGHMPFETPDFTFLNTGNLFSTETTQFVFNFDTLFHNFYLFFIGRFAGLIPYFFPAFIAILAACILGLRNPSDGNRRSTPSRVPLCLVLIGLYLFHLIYIPSNWHGGSCAVGNRYLISWLPGLYLLVRRPPKLSLSLLTAAISAMFTGTIIASPASAFQNYKAIAKQPVFKLFPMEITLLESWPVDDLTHRRVDFTDYFIYFADDNQFGKENGGFWVKGNSRTDLVMRCWKQEPSIVLKIRNGGSPAVIRGRIGSGAFRIRAEAGEFIEMQLEPGSPSRAYNLAGNVSYCYPVSIRVSDGFIPRFVETGSTDHRFLGCHVILQTNS